MRRSSTCSIIMQSQPQQVYLCGGSVRVNSNATITGLQLDQYRHAWLFEVQGAFTSVPFIKRATPVFADAVLLNS